jgi:hypothetical protein
MRSMDQRQQSAAPIVGIVLLAVGLGAFALQQIGVDVAEVLGDGGWPLLVIVPGLILIALAVMPAAPNGVGFAIGGSIVTTVGLLLLYQQSTGHWESWAYAWALLPAAAGAAMTVYGTATGHSELTSVGVRLAAIGASLFAIGFWFFETIFDTGRVPFDLAAWWPVVPIVGGLVLIVRALTRPGDAPPDGGSR